MRSVVHTSREFWTGLLFTVSGLTAVLIARGYPFGTANRMGPGYFPTALGVLLTLVGILALVRSLRTGGRPIGTWALKPTLCVIGSVVLFGLLLERAGLVLSSVTVLLLSAAASRAFRFEWKAAIGLILLVAVCSAGFVKGLGVPMPLLGSWFTWNSEG